jgi:periplasmic protein TonB
MNNPLAMDQAEKVGLGAAVGGHAFLLALLVFGLFQAAKVPMGSDGGGSGDGIAVSIVSEGAASAPAPAPAEIAEEVIEQPEILPEATVAPTPIPTPQPKAVTKPTPRTIPKPSPTPQPRSGTGRGGASDFDKRMKDALGGAGGGAGPAKTKGPGEGAGTGASTKTAGQISREVNAILGPKILRYIRQCAPSGVDVNRIITSVTLNLSASGGVASLTGISQRGLTDNNRPQAQPMERCVTSAIRKAAPFTELNPKDYEGWKTHRMSFQPN